MKAMDFHGRWVLVTGASSGLGEEMARQLAGEHRANLVLVARREERLEQLAAELRMKHGVEVRTIAADLNSLSEVDRVVQQASQETRLYAAVLNAGITHFGHYDELSWDAFERLLSLNVKSTSRFIHHLLPQMERDRDNGGILLVASLAGVTPVAYQSAYSGSKAFLVNYGCSLHHEMKSRGVTVTVFAPGGIATEMTRGERFNDLRSWLVPVGPCARSAIRGFRKRKYLVIPGLIYRWGTQLLKFVPENFVVGRVAAQYRHSLSQNS